MRLLLWLWVAINTATLVTLLVNACFRQAFPGYQFRAQLVVMQRQVADVLTQNAAPPTFKEIAGRFNQLQGLFKQARFAAPEIAADSGHPALLSPRGAAATGRRSRHGAPADRRRATGAGAVDERGYVVFILRAGH